MDEDWYNILDILLLIIIICKVIWTANIREWSSNSLLGASYSKALHFHCFLYCWCWMTFFISVKALSPQTSTSSTFSSKFDFFTFKNTNLIYLQSNTSLIHLQSNIAWFSYNQNQAWFIYNQAFIFNQTHFISTQERGLAKSVGSSWGSKAKILSFCLLKWSSVIWDWHTWHRCQEQIRSLQSMF